MGRKQGPRPVLSFPPEFDAAAYRSRYADLAGLRRSELKQHWRQEGRRGRRNATALESRDDLLRYLQPAGHLLEIGPFDNPSLEPLRRPGLHIDYADYLSRAELVERARLRPERNPEAVPPIRYVLSEGGYDQIQQRYDAVVSHHCLEHQPDLIGHLLQVAGLLKPAGVYLFTLPDWLEAPNPLDGVALPTRALLEAALEEYLAHPYVDVHCWKFTNECFRRLVRQLVALAYLPATTSLRTSNLGNDFAVVLGFTPER